MAVTFCAIGSGSNGNCYLIANEKNKILVDAGFSAKHIAQNLLELGVEPNEIDGIIVTHEHSDHVSGIRVFCKKHGVPVYANEKTLAAMMPKLQDVEPRFLRKFNNGESFYIGTLEIAPFKTPHDSVCSCGFCVYSGNAKITVATDIGHMTRGILENLKYSDLLVLESNYDLEMLENGPYSPFLKQRVQGPNGHLSNDLCGQTVAYLLEFGIKQVLLAHLSEENNTPELAYGTVCQYLNKVGAEDKKDINIEVLSRNARSKCYRII